MARCSRTSLTELSRQHRAALRACRSASRRRQELQAAQAALSQLGREAIGAGVVAVLPQRAAPPTRPAQEEYAAMMVAVDTWLASQAGQ